MTFRLSHAAALALAFALAACGGRVALRPAEGQSMPPKPAAATEAPTIQQLMTPSTQARPDRDAELITRSVKRQDDEFDLPPGKDN